MARLKIVDEAAADTLFADLDKGLGHASRKWIGHNTRLVRWGADAIAIELYNTFVVTVWSDNTVEYQDGGWPSATTASRMQSVASKFGLCVRRHHGHITVG